MTVVEQRAPQSWFSHQVALSDEMNSVAGDALEIQKRIDLLSGANSELRRHHRQNQEHLWGYPQDVQPHLSVVRHEIQRQHVASREEVGILRHELSQSLVEGTPCENLMNTGRSGAFASSS